MCPPSRRLGVDLPRRRRGSRTANASASSPTTLLPQAVSVLPLSAPLLLPSFISVPVVIPFFSLLDNLLGVVLPTMPKMKRTAHKKTGGVATRGNF